MSTIRMPQPELEPYIAALPPAEQSRFYEYRAINEAIASLHKTIRLLQKQADGLERIPDSPYTFDAGIEFYENGDVQSLMYLGRKNDPSALSAGPLNPS